MAITDQNSVLILGAGASVSFGLPLGGALIDLIRELANAELDFLKADSTNTNILFQIIQNKLDGSALLMTNSLKVENRMLSHAQKQSQIIKPLSDLADLLTGQTSETIDDFIAINPRVSEVTKIGIASVFFLYLYEKGKWGRWELKPIAQRVLDPDPQTSDEYGRRNWIHHLINLVRHHNFEASDAPKKVRIISFNYDGILESVLAEQFDNTQHEFGSWNKYIKIVHPHGFMGVLDNSVEDPIAVVKRWASTINVVKEPSPSENVIRDREIAASWISDAREIYMAGFALSGPNAAMLGLGNRDNPPQDWHIANFDGSPGLRRSIERFVKQGPPTRTYSDGSSSSPKNGHITHFPEEGIKGDELHIDTWFSIGVPGEMPA